MEKTKKRERNVNFTRDETEKLVSIIEAYKYIVETKKSDAVTWQEKEKAWNAIATEFNSYGGGTFRDAKNLKIKFEGLKREIRKKNIANHSYPLTPVEQRVKEIMLLSVEGGESLNDSDQLEVPIGEVSVEILDPAEDTVQPVDLERPMTESDTSNDSNDLGFEKPAKEQYLHQANDCLPNTSRQEDEDIHEPLQKKWAEWKRTLKSKKHHAFFKSRERRPFDKRTEGKSEIAELLKKFIEEKIEEKILKKQMLKDEMQYKNELYKLEREQMLLRNEILKTELENKRGGDKI